MKPRKPDETDAQYIARLEASNASLRQQGKWAERASNAITELATEGSLVFQAMAEKAGVRSHPSVTEAVRLFDMIAHPQWASDTCEFPKIEFPTDWDIDPLPAWSGDADMELNSPIDAAIEYLRSRVWKAGQEERRHIEGLIDGLSKPLQGVVDGILPERKAPPLVEVAGNPAELVSRMSWAAYEIAEDMCMSNQFLRRDLRAASYRSIYQRLCELGSVEYLMREAGGSGESTESELPF